MPSATSVAETISAYLVESFLLDDDELAPDASLIDNGVLDSTGVMEVITFLEETFAIEVDDEDLVSDNLDSVTRLAQFVMRKRAPTG